MNNEIRQGRMRYISFIILNLFCLFLSFELSSRLYLQKTVRHYRHEDYLTIMVFMLVIDVLAATVFNTLRRVLRRGIITEVIQSARHVFISFAILALLLFSIKQGADYSRVTAYLTYGFDFILIVVMHLLWKNILKLCKRKRDKTQAMLMTTDKFVDEGMNELEKRDIQVRCIYLLKNIRRNEINGIHVAKDIEEMVSIICWNWMDKVYIYGLDHQMIPERLISVCKEMSVKIESLDFDYKIIEVKTVQNEDPKYGSLSFLEGKRDIPFPIRRVYWITETEASLHRGFHAHKLNCQLLFCPHGKIDIILDDGKSRNTVRLDGPEKGLLLMPGLWREMVWQESGSVLCVLASEYYDPDEYIRDYDEFISYKKEYEDEVA